MKKKKTYSKDMDMNNLYVLVGIIGSGKSTWVSKNKDRIGGFIIDPDKIRKMLHCNKYIFVKEIEPAIYKMSIGLAVDLLKKGNVIFDDLSHTKKRRRNLIKKAKGKCRIIAVIFTPTTNKKELYRRLRDPRGLPEEVWEKVYCETIKDYESPSFNEGFDLIMHAN